uniref:PNPLA domain-containing protein n=1 Tax=viral metagenome TaxID=1070528 RepID=A0A6C0I0P4_9ZZZZ
MDNENKEEENPTNEENVPTETDQQEEPQQPQQPDIRHLVLSGGGLWGFKTCGALRVAAESNIFDISKLESIFCTSVGSMIGVVLCMKFDFTIIEDYLVKRPWQHVLNLNVNIFLNIFQTRGIFDINFIKEYLTPFFKARDYDNNITMLEFYEKTGIEFHIYITELNEFECIDVSYKTHPDWTVIETVYMSCCVPIVFSPIIRQNKCYVDGSLLMNYPLGKCIEYVGTDTDKILAIFLTSQENPIVLDKKDISETSNFFDYIMVIIQRIFKSRFFYSDTSYKIKNEMRMSFDEFTIEYINLCIYSSEERRRIIEEGAQKMREWISNNFIKIE